MKLFYKKVSTLPLPLLGGSQREARETAQRLSRPVAHRESGFPVPGLSGLHPRQFTGVAPLSIRAHGSSLSLVLIEPPAHVRGPVPGLSIRALGRRLNAASVRATSARARRELCVVLPPPLGRGPSAAQKRKLGKQRPQARTFPQGAASQAAGRMRPFFQKSCKKPFTFSTLAQYTGG